MLRAVLITTALASAYVLAKPYAERHVDPDALRMQSGNTVLYDHRAECWQGAEPAHVKMPGHVIMRIEGGTHKGRWFYGGPNYVRIALDDVFTHDNPHVYIRAFCE